jgi:hypothetical protein
MYILFSYNSVDKMCHVPDDSSAATRNTVRDLYGSSQTNYKAYITVASNTPTDPLESSGADYFYYMPGTDMQTSNLDISGVTSDLECYNLCQLNTANKCWVFR